MWKANKCSNITECIFRPQGLVLLLLPCTVFLTLYLLSLAEPFYKKVSKLTSKNDLLEFDEVPDEYLVWNPKCCLKDKNPFDESIMEFVKKESYQNCSSFPLLTTITRETNGKIYLVMIPEEVKKYKHLTCCYAPVHRPVGPFRTDDRNIDSRIRADECRIFNDNVELNHTVEIVLVRCGLYDLLELSKRNVSELLIIAQLQTNPIYSNVHAVLNPIKVQGKILNASDSNYNGEGRKLSVLVIGLDSMSRLNFQRTMPLTKEYLDKQGWLELRGYNKMGDNTYPNLMAVISGLSETMAFTSVCNPKKSYLNDCPIIWYAFRDAGYITGYGEDGSRSTFNYEKRGFADPPTDYYLRPYILATEEFLSLKSYFSKIFKYCTGPESSFFRILNYAQDFAQTFIKQPYFGFFWMNSVSHDDLNAPSSIDEKFLNKLIEMNESGVINDSMVILLSDHGMRFGDFRKTVYGWYEDRLPTVYISLPPWFREQNPKAYEALSVNRNRLTSPYDLYATLRDVLLKAGGAAAHSKGCPNCTSLFNQVPKVRGCDDVGVDQHWCACNTFKKVRTEDKVVVEGAYKFLEFIDSLVENYTENGIRQCAKFTLKKIHRAWQSETKEGKSIRTKTLEIFYELEVEPGGVRYETTAHYDSEGNYFFREQDISRINSYHNGSMCLKEGKKMFCECIK